MPNANGESMYAGMRHPKKWGRKYERAEYVKSSNIRVRKLMPAEVEQFRESVQRIIEGDVARPRRLED